MRVLCAVLACTSLACASRAPVAPPPSQMPDARAAIARMRAAGDCGNAIEGEATLDVSGKPPGFGKARLDVVAARGSRLRFGATAPVVGVLGTLANDGDRFAMHDAREGRYVFGPSCASAADLPVSPFVLSELLRGQAPVLRDEGSTIAWNDRGYYVVRIASTRNASEELHLAPAPTDWSLLWSEQRMRVLDVRVWEEGILLYHAELDGHVSRAPAKRSQRTLDDEAVSAVLGEPPERSLGPNGPSTCNAEIPARIRVRVPAKNEDAVFRWQEASWNPELTESTFQVRIPQNVRVQQARCP